MALDEGEFGASEPKPRSKKSGLSKWDTVAKSDPYSIPGTASYRPPTVGTGATRFSPASLTKLTPYAMPVEVEPQISYSASTKQPEAKQGVSSREAATSMAVSQQYPAADRQAEEERVAERLQTEPKTVRRRTYQMSWEDYNKLNDEQRAAVDFNTLLIQAREKDLNAEYDASDKERAKYNAEVDRMFGADRGSETFAPETLAVLKQVDFQASGEDLDDFLGLEHAISVKELKNFEIEPDAVKPPLLPRTETQNALSPTGGLGSQAQLAEGTSALQASIAKAGEVLQNFRATAARDRNDDVLALGGLANEVKVARGYGERPAFTDQNGDGVADEGNFHGFAQDTLAALANKKLDPEVAFTNMDAVLNDGEKQQIMRFFDEQTRVALKHGTGVLGIEGKDIRNPVEIRQLLGLKGD